MTARGIPNTFMMEGIRCEQIETSSEIGSKIKTESITEINSTLYEEDGKLVELDSELQEDVCAVLKRIKYEKTEIAEEIDPLSETYEIPRSIQSLEFSRIISESTDYTPSMSLCRLCATRSNSMVYMFSQNELQNNIIEKIEYCFSIEVKKTDTLPKEVCHFCLEKLELSYQFHKTVKAAEKQFLTFNDGQCNKKNYKSFSDQDVRSNIINQQAILQELPKTNTEPAEDSTVLTNSMSRNETYCVNKPNKDSRTESSSDKGSQSTCNSLLTSHLHDIGETLRFEINDSLKEEARSDESNDDSVVREELFNRQTLAEQSIIGHELIKCHNCRATFEAVNQCLPNSRIRASKGYFPCYLCDVICRTKEDFNRHRLEHRASVFSRASEEIIALQCKRDFSFECKLCNRRFRSNYELETHKKTDCSRPLVSTEKEFSCTYCGQRFRRKGDLKLHLRVHTGERSYDCDVCGKMFRIKDIKDAQLKLYRGTRPFKCSKCNKSFTKSSTLMVHSLVHSDARPYNCHLCHLSFKTLRGRELHLTIHTGDRPFKCSKCEKSFPTSSALTCHSSVHSDAKPYSCHLCHASFKKKYTRDKHLRKHTGEKPYQCDICGICHTKLSLFLRHRRLRPCLKTLAARGQN